MDPRRIACATAVVAAGALLLSGALVSAAPAGGFGAQPASGAGGTLYRCADGAPTVTAALGIELCDGEPTPLLAARAEPDNLQVRAGALVVAVGPGGVAAREGVQPGDLIYRVAGADAAGADDVRAGVAATGPNSDTQINFLRRGRPYRIKLRR